MVVWCAIAVALAAKGCCCCERIQRANSNSEFLCARSIGLANPARSTRNAITNPKHRISIILLQKRWIISWRSDRPRENAVIHTEYFPPPNCRGERLECKTSFQDAVRSLYRLPAQL